MRFRPILAVALVAAPFVTPLVAPRVARAQAMAQAAAPNGTFYMGTYANKIMVIDEASLAVRDSIQLSIGIPYRMLLSENHQHFYILNPRTDQVEIVDIPSRKTTGNFTLNTPRTIVEIAGMAVDPKERFAILLIKSTIKRADRYEISRPTLVRYDLAKRAVTDTIPWPRGEERDNAQIIFSPDGANMYFFTSSDVLVYDAATLKQVDTWDLTQTFYEEGVGRINAGFGTDPYEEPGFYTNLFRSTDPVNHRAMMGVARIDLAKRSVDFYSLGPSVATTFRLAPGKKRAYGIHSEVGNYQFWTFDLENRRVLGKTEFEGRSRMGMTVSTNGAFLYIHTAGPTIDVFDAGTYKKLRTATYDADMTALVLIPAQPAGAGR